MKSLRSITLALWCAAGLLALTVEAQGDAFVFGAGAMSCYQAMDNFKYADVREGDIQWAMGFLSGINVGRGKAYGADAMKNLSTIDPETLVFAMQRSCEHNPNTNLMDPLIQIYNTLPPMKW